MPKIMRIGHTDQGQGVDQITLSCGAMQAGVLTYGATLQDLRINGINRSLVMRSDSLADYLGPLEYVGAIVGRYANRIGGAKFKSGTQEFDLDRNFMGKHCLHGGAMGTSHQVWAITDCAANAVTLSLDSPDGQGGFPGNLGIVARYMIADSMALCVDIWARTDAPTPVSFAHHSYVNLGPNQKLQIAADQVLRLGTDQIPTGAFDNIADTALDFRALRAVGDSALDHNFCLRGDPGAMRPVARVVAGDVALDLQTNAPGLQAYDGRHLRPFGHFGLALEPQNWPDAPNHAHFPNAILRPGETYHQQSIYQFTKFHD
jgi:aldose 1-epimerase